MFQTKSERAEWLTKEKATEMDLNGDGKVSKEEYILYMLIEMDIVDHDEIDELKNQFERFDVTRSGYIESGDLEAMERFRAAKKLSQKKIEEENKIQ